MNVQTSYTDDEKEILSADKVIFPGVGEASTAMKYIKDANILKVLPKISNDFLGICLGMQLLYSKTEENSTPCLGIIKGNIKKFSHQNLKVPHMGWNTISPSKDPLLAGVNENDYFYFVHSYYAGLTENTLATTSYGTSFCSVVRKDNFWATQFHPEKSGTAGKKILENFLSL